MSDPGHQRLLTYADYAALPDDGHRYQLLEGELVVTPSPNRWHQEISIQLASELLRYVLVPGRGSVFAAPDLCVEILSHGTERIDRVREGSRTLRARPPAVARRGGPGVRDGLGCGSGQDHQPSPTASARNR